MARQVKCPYCEQKLDKEDAYEYKKKYYHEDCFNTWRQDIDDRKSLIEYICELYNLDAPTGMMLKQIKEFHEDYKYKYKGMELALGYFHDTLENRAQDNTGIGIIPFVYEEAKNHYIKQQRISESLSSYKNEETTVYINLDSNKRNSKKIDITAI